MWSPLLTKHTHEFSRNCFVFLYGCRILLSTLWRFHCQIFQLLVCRQGRNAHFDACVCGGPSITSLQKKMWLVAEPNSALAPQSSDPQCMTPTNTCTPVDAGQNWSNIRSSWPNSEFAKPVTDCLGGNSL